MDNKLTPKEQGEANKQKILDTYAEYVETNGKAPTIQYLVDTVGVTKPVIYKHLRNLQLNEIGIKFKPRAIAILEGIAKKAEQGDYNCARLILNLAYGYSERKQIDVTSTNKSIKVIFNTSDKDDITKIANNIKESVNTEYEEVNNEPDTE